MKQKLYHAGMFGLVISGVGLGMVGCGSKSASDSATNSISLTGSLNNTGTTVKVGNSFRQTNGPVQMTQNFSGISVVCTTLSNPPVSGSGAVNANGSFTVTLNGVVNQPMNCNLVASSGNILAAIVTSDASHTDMHNNPTTQSTVAFTGSANLGTISYNPQTGTASIPIANIQASIAPPPVAANVFDPTGEWTIAAAPFALPTGYSELCQGEGDNCNGPPAGQLLKLQQYKGVRSSDSSTAVFGLQIWQGGNSARTACGPKIGMTHAQALAVGIDFSATGLEGAFTYNSSVTISGTPHALTADYQIDGATSTFDVQTSCASRTLTVAGVSQIGYVCTGRSTDNSRTLYQASLGGGCVDVTSHLPIQINGPWTPDSGSSCTTVSLGDGFQTNTCTGTYTDSNTHVLSHVSCSNGFGVFSDSGLTTAVAQTPGTNANNFDYSNLAVITSNTRCDDAAFNSYPLQRAQCFVQYYQENVDDHGSGCLKRVNTDWSATDATHFLQIGNNPKTLVAFNEFHPDPTGQGGSMRMEDTEIQGIRSSGSSTGGGYTACHTFEVDEFSYKRIDDNNLLTTFQSTTVTTDTDRPECVAAFGSAGNGSVQKFLFLLHK